MINLCVSGLNAIAEDKERIKSSLTSINEEFGKVLQFPSISLAKDKTRDFGQNNAFEENKKDKSVSITLKFTQKDISKMAKTFKKEFIANGLVARVIKRESGKNSFCYEIRYRRNGYNIEVSSTDLAKAKLKFLEATKPENIEKYATATKQSGFHLFKEVATEWLIYKKGKISKDTLNSYESYARRYVYPIIGEKPISSIRTIDVDNVLNEKTPRLYEDLRTVLNSVFKYAINSGLITHNPVALIPFKRAERQNRRALTKEEQLLFAERIFLPEFKTYKQAFLIMFYFGLRPCELKNARFEGTFLIAQNAKRKGGKIEYKKIPVPKQAQEKLDITQAVSAPVSMNKLNDAFKRILQDDTVTQYYLRHTFATTCQQFVRPDIVDIWMGDSSERLVGRVYTHFPDEFMQKQMDFVHFEI